MKVRDWAGIELATPGSAVRLASVARHVTERKGVLQSESAQLQLFHGNMDVSCLILER